MGARTQMAMTMYDIPSLTKMSSGRSAASATRYRGISLWARMSLMRMPRGRGTGDPSESNFRTTWLNVMVLGTRSCTSDLNSLLSILQP